MFALTDPAAGQVAFIGTVREEARDPDGLPTAIALRLKVENRQITQIETLMVRSTVPPPNAGRGQPQTPQRPTGAAVNMERLGTPNRLFADTIPPADRMSREDLVKTANIRLLGHGKERRQGRLSVHRRLQPHRERLTEHECSAA